MRKLILGVAMIAALIVPSAAMADSSMTTFDTLNVGNINDQGGWSNTGLYDANVVSNGPGLGNSLSISNTRTGGGFGDMTISPTLKNPASTAPGAPHTFDAQFTFYAKEYQAGRRISVSPDNGFAQPGFGPGGRMSYLRFVDNTETNGVDVYFNDVPSNTLDDDKAVTFKESLIGTLSYGKPHQIRFLMTVKKSPNDQAKVFLDGKLSVKGTTWEKYYESDIEAKAWQDADHLTPVVAALMFRTGGDAAPVNGYLIDNVSLATGS